MKSAGICLSFCLVFFGNYYVTPVLAQSLDVPSHSLRDAWSATADFEYFNSDVNYDQDGAEQDITLGRSFTHYLTRFEGHFNLGSGWSVAGGGRLARAESVGVIEDRTTTEMTDLLARVRHSYRLKPVIVTPELEGVITLSPVERGRDRAIAGEGTNEISAGAWLEYPLRRIRPYAFAGYRYRDDGRSSLLQWRAGLRSQMNKFWAGAEARGAFSVTDDEFTETPTTRHLEADAVNGGSLRYYAVNPKWTDAAVYAGFEVNDTLDFEAGYRLTVAGANTASGNTIFLAMKLAFERRPERVKPETGVQFEPELEKYDEKIFKDQ